ncbi:MAG: nitrilase-related carbon-nitrogen hydrolase [Chloroflexota bacterium]
MMKLSVAQFEPKLFDKKGNTERIIEMIGKSDADMIVFPELATTGYFFKGRAETLTYAEPFDGGESLSAVAEAARKADKAVVVGFAELAPNGDCFNSCALLLPEGERRLYRKSHLFYREKFCFAPGDTGFFTVKWKRFGVNIGMMICYDWRFPESARTLALRGADLIVCPSNLVTDVWHISMPSRALENKVYLAVANRVGEETRGEETLIYKGLSAIYGYNGALLAKAGATEEVEISAIIEPSETRNKSFNEFNNIFTDRRPELYA